MTHSIQAIAAAIGGEAVGDTALTIVRATEPADAGPDDLAMAMTPRFQAAIGKGQARAALLAAGTDWQGLGLAAAILAPRARLAMAGLTALLDPGQGFAAGIHPSAVVDPTAVIGANVSIGPLSVIGPRARIGAGSVIGPHCVIGAEVTLGDNAFLREMVSIGARARIGARFVAQPGVRIGGDGFSFVTPEVSGVEMARATLGDQGDAKPQAWLRIHSLGSVTIGDDVEIGANSTVDSGTIRDTVIGSGTKLDSQVQVGHNVRIGTDCLLCAQAGVAGSSEIGNNVVLGGQTGVGDNLTVGDRVIAAGATKILSNVPEGRVMMGYPAVKMDAFTEAYKVIRRLPRLARDVAALKNAVFKGNGSE
ncbi:MAG: UDP-3-O-(3-hydroxymyristoyl)glucosamine N-acyltransferase [Pseudooceanicola sp.]|nr:UDP-3-O-(3-hydroxymyristoyl)glucosamine N-acyltransferase [Pseudooceanicola sp.]